MLKIIINADDFGLNEKVNEGILRSFRNGILRSASLMANGNSFEQAVGIINSNPNLDIGVHLTLVEEKPILDIDKIPTKTDYFTGFYFGGKLSKKNLLTLINYLPSEGMCELMCHPGLNPNSNIYDQRQYRQVDETLTLIDKDVAEEIKQKDIEITSFRNLLL